jgi:hypothetical protein
MWLLSLSLAQLHIKFNSDNICHDIGADVLLCKAENKHERSHISSGVTESSPFDPQMTNERMFKLIFTYVHDSVRI